MHFASIFHLHLFFLKRGSMCPNNSEHSDQSSPLFIKRFSKKSEPCPSMRMAKKRRCRLRERKTCHLGITKEGIQAGFEEMEMENLKLYLENKFIIEENKRLRERALVLGRENSALLCHLTEKSQ